MDDTKTVITITKVKTCETCKGRGKTEQCEYTPPFERFMGQCSECKGSGTKLITYGNSKGAGVK